LPRPIVPKLAYESGPGRWEVERFGQPLVPAWYIMLYGLIGLVILWPMRETNTRRLDE
jgi:hypothetical protein